MQAGDMAGAEKDLQVLVKERDPRAQYLLGLYVYGNPDSKLFRHPAHVSAAHPHDQRAPAQSAAGQDLPSAQAAK